MTSSLPQEVAADASHSGPPSQPGNSSRSTPSAPPKKPLARFLDALLARHVVITWLLLLLGSLGLAALPLLDRAVEFEEKALLPGSATPSLLAASPQLPQKAARFAADSVRQRHNLTWLQGQLRGAGLEVTASCAASRAAGGAGRCCSSLHAILRAPRGDGKEALLLVTPLHAAPSSSSSAGPESEAAAAAAALEADALALGAAWALMAHLQRVAWLAKDLVWLIPGAGAGAGLGECSSEEGVAAWAAAYHEAPQEDAGSGQAACGELGGGGGFGRAGILQQGVVVEVVDAAFDSLELRLVGAEGSLPKLDVYLLLRQAAAQALRVPVLAQTGAGMAAAAVRGGWRGDLQRALQRLAGLLRFMGLQAAGMPSGPHAGLKAYQVDAATMALVRRAPTQLPPGALRGLEAPIAALAEALELSVRSLSGLVERLHHSFLLYVLTSADTFLPVEMYVLPLVALCLATLLQAAAAKRQADEAEAAAAAACRGAAALQAQLAAGGAEWWQAACTAATLYGTSAAASGVARLTSCHSWSPAPVGPMALLAGGPLAALLAGRLANGCAAPRPAGACGQAVGQTSSCDTADAKLRVVVLSITAISLTATTNINWASAYCAALLLAPMALVMQRPRSDQAATAQRLLLAALSPPCLLMMLTWQLGRAPTWASLHGFLASLPQLCSTWRSWACSCGTSALYLFGCVYSSAWAAALLLALSKTARCSSPPFPQFKAPS